MSERVFIRELNKHVGKNVLLKGFVHAIRRQGSISFVVLRDITGTTQTVTLKSNKEAFDFIKTLTPESSVEIKGVVKAFEKAPNGIEVNVSEATMISPSATDLPIPVYEKGTNETSTVIRHQQRFLDLRKPKNALIMKLSSEFDRYYREFLLQQGFFEIHTPKLMPTPSESTSNLFEVKYFNKKAYLAQSPQLYKQMAIASGMEKVFEVAPIFRAEKSFTTRHATECTSYDVEMAYIKDHEDVMRLEENMIVFILSKIKESYGDEIKELYGIDLKVPEIPFPRITMQDAKKLLGSKDTESDLSSDEEKALGDYFSSKGQDFVFLTDFPIKARPFYHKHYNDKPCTKSADLIYKGLEITTLAQREERPDVLTKQLKDKGLGTKDIQWYLDFFKYGVPPHGGFGLGGARFIKQLLNLESIREAMFIYRGVNYLYPQSLEKMVEKTRD